MVLVTDPGEKTNTYGSLQHEIAFDPSNITSTEVDAIGQAFQQLGFFDQEEKKFLYVKQAGSELVISISSPDTIANDSAVVARLKALLWDMRRVLPDRHITFDLVVGSLDNVVKRLK